MAKAIWGEERISTSIRLENVSEEMLRKIKAFIASTVTREAGESVPKKSVPEVKELSAVNDIPDVKESVPAGESTAETKAEPDKYADIIHCNGWDKVVAIIRDAEKYPEKYKWEYMIPKEWMTYFSDLHKRNAPIVIGSMASRNIIKPKVRKYNESTREVENLYCLPVPDKNGETKIPETQETIGFPTVVYKPEDARNGAILRKERMAHGFFIAEIGKATGYDATVILNFENGCYSMSDGAKKAFSDFFKKNIFAVEGA